MPANDRGKLDRALAILTETVQPRHNDSLSGIGHAHLVKIFNEAIVTILPLEHAEIEEGLGDLLDELGQDEQQRHGCHRIH